jgi:hypothetical protein
MNTSTVCIFDGPSNFNGERVIVLIAGYSRPSANTKTGNMLQSFIIPVSHESIRLAVLAGADQAVCGNCKLRPANNGNIPCYVDVVRGPGGAYRSWKSGNVWTVTPENAGAMATAPLRIGSWGDPACVDSEIWRRFEGQSSHKSGTGYTHDWLNNPGLSDITMASIDPDNHPDTDEAMARAHALGFRTYRVLKPGDKPRPDEFLCPEVTHGVTCADCRLCGGNRISARNVAIPAI